MTLLKGFAAGTPGFGPEEGKYAALAVARALKRSDAPANRGQAITLLEGARQVRVCRWCRATFSVARSHATLRVAACPIETCVLAMCRAWIDC